MVDGKLWWENGRKTFWSCMVGWEGKKINGGTQVFSLRAHQNVFSSKWRENWKEKLDIIFGQKCPYAIAYGLAYVALLQFFFLFPFPFLSSWTWPLLFLLLFFSWFFCFCLDVIFFSRHDSYFLINLGEWFFFFFVYHFYFILIGYHFLIRVYS